MITVQVKGVPLANVDALSFSSVDPGGYESCSFTVSGGPRISVGDDVRVFEGHETVWHGRVEEPGFQILKEIATNQVNAVGYGARLKDNLFSIIYIDKDTSAWTNMPRARERAAVAANLQPRSGEQTTDTSSGRPGLMFTIEDAWASPYRPLCELWYDAGFGNTIGRAFSSWEVSNIAATFESVIFFSPDDSGSTGESSADQLTGNASGSVDYTPKADTYRYAFIYFLYTATPGGTAGDSFKLTWSGTSVLGNHGLVLRGNDLRLTDIVTDAIARSRVRFNTEITESEFLVSQAVYKELTTADMIFDDMIALNGWHWGVWAPDSVFSDTPTFVFAPPPQQPTCRSMVADCDEFDVTESFSRLHNKIIVSYTDTAGRSQYVEYKPDVPDPLLGTDDHVLQVNIGISTDDSAKTAARYILSLDRSDSRVSGTCLLPETLNSGRWSHTLRPGIDKITFPDVPNKNSYLDDPPLRNDVFRIARLNVTVQNGKPVSSIEFDQGASLIEVMQARLAQGNATIGL